MFLRITYAEGLPKRDELLANVGDIIRVADAGHASGYGEVILKGTVRNAEWKTWENERIMTKERYSQLKTWLKDYIINP